MSRSTLFSWIKRGWPALLAVAVLFSVSSSGFSDIPPEPPEVLTERASHILEGKVGRIYSTAEDRGDWRYQHKVAAIGIEHVKKGTGVSTGDRLYVRFWNKQWIGKGPLPPGFSGHRGIPRLGEKVRVYLTNGQDGGFDVLAPNGFQKVGN